MKLFKLHEMASSERPSVQEYFGTPLLEVQFFLKLFLETSFLLLFSRKGQPLERTIIDFNKTSGELYICSSSC